MTEQIYVKGTLRGHNNWVTQIATNPKFPDMILSSSRGTNDCIQIYFFLLCVCPVIVIARKTTVITYMLILIAHFK